MSEFEDIQRLLRLKRFETPGEDFVEDFLTQFRERQRSEMLRHSARGLLWERVSTYFDAIFAPRWGMALATASVAIVAAWGSISLLGGAAPANQFAMQTGGEATLSNSIQSQPALAVDSQLIKEAEDDRQIQIESVLLSNHFEDGLAGVAHPGSGFVPVSIEMAPLSDFGR